MSDWSEGDIDWSQYDDVDPYTTILESLGLTPADMDIAQSGAMTGAGGMASTGAAADKEGSDWATGSPTTGGVAGTTAPDFLSKLMEFMKSPQGRVAAGGIGALAGLLGSRSRAAQQKPTGYQGGIPRYTATREMLPVANVAGPAARMGQRYFSDTRYMAQGGMAKGRYLDGPTDGMADKLPAHIDNKQPAALSHGEFVIPADVVSHLGNGNSSAGAQRLYQMMARIRKARTGTTKQGRRINPDKFLPK